MTPIYTAPQLLMEVGKRLQFVSGYDKVNELREVCFNYRGTTYETCHGYTRTNGRVDCPDWEGVALLFVSGSQSLVPDVMDSRFHVLHQTARLYIVHSNTLATEGELLVNVIDSIFLNKDIHSTVKWIRDVYAHEVMVAHDPSLIFDNRGKNVSTAFPLLLNRRHDVVNTVKLAESFARIYKKRTAAEEETNVFSIKATELDQGADLMNAPQFSDEDVAHFLRILDSWIASDLLQLEVPEISVYS